MPVPTIPSAWSSVIDEGTKELRDTINGVLDIQPEQPTRQNYEYERLSKANLFLSVEP